MTIAGRRIPMALSLLVWFALWEIVGQLELVFLIPPFTEVLAAIGTVVTSDRFAEAALITLQAYGIGMALSLVVGIGMGFWMGRVQAVGELMGMWANIFESSPLTAIVPALMALLGFGLPTMIVTVFLFSVWVIALDTQVGVARVSQSLLEMGRSFGAGRRQVLTKIVLPAALPEILAGVRLGLIRGREGRDHRAAADRDRRHRLPVRALLARLPDGRVLGAADHRLRLRLRAVRGGRLLRAARRRLRHEPMTTFAIPPSPPVTLPVDGLDAVFPVLRVFCVGRNYAEHAVEMGHDPDREPPFFFMKPAVAVVPDGGRLPFPVATDDLHHEVELVVALGSGGSGISVEAALEHVFGYGVGLDMTRRDIQATAKEMGRPWDMGKGFDRSAPISALRPAEVIGHPDAGAIWLRVNGSVRQEGDLAQQIWKVPETIALLSTLVELRPGDLIMTGTPAGVGRVVPGDVLEGHVDGVGQVRVEYAGR